MNTIEKIEKVRDMFMVSSEPYKLLSEALSEMAKMHDASKPVHDVNEFYKETPKDEPAPKKGKR